MIKIYNSLSESRETELKNEKAIELGLSQNKPKFYSTLRLLQLLTLFCVFFTGFTVKAQIGVTVTNPSNTTPALSSSYTDLTTAVAALNGVTAMSGPVVFTLAAGTSETAPVKGFNISTATAGVLNSTNTLTIVKAAGGPTVINAGIGTSAGATASPDGMMYLDGSDYVTIDGLTFTDGNSTSSTDTMEFGIAFFKRSAGDGCNFNTIQNCTFTMQRLNFASGSGPVLDGSWAVQVLNSTSIAAITALTPTNGGTLETNGTNSNNRFYTNTTNNGNGGIGFNGFAATAGVGPTPTATTFLGDLGNDVGGNAPANGNTILNFGGGAGATNPSAGIRANNQWSLNVRYNNINSNTGSGVNHPNTLRGIYAQSGISANVTISNNIVSVKSAALTSFCAGIDNVIGSTAAANTVTISSNTIQDCTYSTGTTAAFSGIQNAATAATSNITNNIIQNNIYGGATTTGTFNGILQSGVNTTTNFTSNQVINNSLGQAGQASTCTFNGIYCSVSTTTVNMSSNSVTGNQLLNNWGSMYCMRNSTSTLNIDGNTIANNSIPNNTGATSSILYGIYDGSSPVIENYTNNNINNQIISGSGTSTTNAIYGIYLLTASGVKTISGNNVNNLRYSSSSTGSATVTGIRDNYASTANIFKNVIHTLSSTGAAPLVAGIQFGSTTFTTANVYNNIIGNLDAPQSTANSLFGIWCGSAGTTYNVSYNTVYLKGNSSASGFASAALFMSSATPTVTLTNNIFVNLSVGTTTWTTAVIRRASTSLTTYGTASNNNLLYAGPPSATNLIFFDGTNSDQTIGAFKTRVTPRESASVSETVSATAGVYFQSLTGPATGTATTFLHLVNGLSTQVESGGITVAGITDDYDGNTRSANPDIGADEFSGVLADLSPPSFSAVAATGNSCGVTSRTITAILADPSGVDEEFFDPKIYFRKNGGAYTSAVGSLTSGTVISGTWTFTITYSAVGGVVIGDVIEYFIVAQDAAGNPGGSPSTGLVLSDVNTITSPPTTPLAFTIQNTISGTFTVGSGGDYATLTAAAAAYNNSCLSGPVVFSLIDALYSVSEIFPITFNANLDASATNTLTIRPAASNTVTITGAVSPGSILKLNGADYVTIDGSNNGGTSRDLTISNTTATTTGNAVVWLASPATGNGANNNTVRNTIIEGNTSTTSFIGLHIGGNATITLTAVGLERNNSNTVTNCLFRKTQYGLTAFGFAAATPDLNNVISNNNFGTAVAGEGFALIGINADRQENLIVSGNEIQNVTNATSAATFLGGIRLLDFKNGLCYNNNIHDLSYTGTSTPKYYGIGVTSSTYTTVGNPSNAMFYNNTVSRITSTGTSGVWNVTGILAGAGYGDKFYHNTVHLTGQLANSTTGLVAAFANGDGNFAAVGSNIDVRNNIFNVEGSNGATGGNFWAYYTPATTLVGSTLNYNLLRCAGTGTNLTNNTGRFNAVNHVTLASWQAATGQDANSTATQPVFTSNTDLHLNMGVTSTPIESGGTTVGITTDIDGQVRPGPAGSVNGGATAPDLGADEFDGVPPAPMVYSSSTTEQITGNAYVNVPNQAIIRVKVVTTGLLNPIALTSLTLNAVGTTSITDIDATPARVYYTGSSTTFSTATLFGSATPTVANYNVTGSQFLASGDNYFWLAYDVSAGAIAGNVIDAEATGLIVNAVSYTPSVTAPAGNKVVVGPLSGAYTVGAGGNYPSLTNSGGAFEELNLVGASANITFNITSDLSGELGTHALNQVTGGFAVLIKPSGAPRAISGSNLAALIKLNGADNVTIDGSTSGGTDKSLTISNATSGSTVISIVSLGEGLGATNNTVKNCLISTGVSTTIGYGISVGGNTPGTNGADNDNTTIQNNSITVVPVGIYAIGTAAVTVGGNDNLNIIGNTIDYNGTLASLGIRAGNALNSTVSQNTITEQTTASQSPTAISLETGFVSSMVARNYITKVVTTNAGGYGGRGITVGTGTTTSNLTIANNMISGVNGTNWSGFSNSSAIGIGIGMIGNSGTLTTVAGGINIYYNSVNIYGSIGTSTTNRITTALYIGSGASALDIRNNILVNTQTGTAIGQKNFAIYSAAANTAFTNINYNDYYVFNSFNAPSAILGFIGSDRTDLAGIIAGFGGNANSVNIAPVFTSDSDLHLDAVANVALTDLGTFIPAVTIDYDGVTRSITTPDIGADEWSGSSIVNLKLFIEGYYIGSSTMRSVNLNQGVGVVATDVETITVELHNSTAPYAVAATTTAMLQTNGNVTCTFNTAPSGNFFVVVKTRNAVETWSSGALPVGGTPLTFDFSSDSSNAYGDNMKDLGAGVWGFYSGDVDPGSDGNIDTIDYPIWETDSNNFASGVFDTDLNGDGNVDTIDYPIWEANSNNFVSVIRP